jgi:hypothetical protein
MAGRDSRQARECKANPRRPNELGSQGSGEMGKVHLTKRNGSNMRTGKSTDREDRELTRAEVDQLEGPVVLEFGASW